MSMYRVTVTWVQVTDTFAECSMDAEREVFLRMLSSDGRLRDLPMVETVELKDKSLDSPG